MWGKRERLLGRVVIINVSVIINSDTNNEVINFQFCQKSNDTYPGSVYFLEFEKKLEL